MGRFQIHRCSPPVIEGGFPAGHANAPFVTGLETRKTPFRPGRHQIVAVQHGEIEKVSSDVYADGVQADVFRAGATESVSIKSSHRIPATAFEFGAQNVRRHGVDISMTRWVVKQSTRAGPETVCAKIDNRAPFGAQ